MLDNEAFTIETEKFVDARIILNEKIERNIQIAVLGLNISERKVRQITENTLSEGLDGEITGLNYQLRH